MRWRFPRPAASGANCQPARQRSLGPSGKGCGLLVSYPDPFDTVPTPDRIGDPVERIAGDAINPLHARRCEYLDEQFRHSLSHFSAPSVNSAETNRDTPPVPLSIQNTLFWVDAEGIEMMHVQM